MSTSPDVTGDALAARLEALPKPPSDEGAVVLVVVRSDEGERLTPSRCRITKELGVLGDRWSRRESPVLSAQVSMMRADVASVLAGEKPVSLIGDNLLVDLDLSLDNLPTGTRLAVGSALCEVTPKPHNGCAKFAERFGQAAREITGAEAFRGARLRGLFVRVLEEGEVGPGDRVRVLSRETPDPSPA